MAFLKNLDDFLRPMLAYAYLIPTKSNLFCFRVATGRCLQNNTPGEKFSVTAGEAPFMKAWLPPQTRDVQEMNATAFCTAVPSSLSMMPEKIS